MSLLEVKNLKKSFDDNVVLKDISLSVEKGEVLGFLGPNGAGKSTTMNIITGYLSATNGDVLIDGFDILKDPINAKEQIGYLPENPPLYLDMTVKEYLNFVFELKGVKLPKGPHIEEICKLVKIKDVYHRLIKNLSKGYKQRVGIAQALIGNPKLLILDEPMNGLDKDGIAEVRKLLLEMKAEGKTMIITSHNEEDIKVLCDKVVEMDKGKLL